MLNCNCSVFCMKPYKCTSEYFSRTNKDKQRAFQMGSLVYLKEISSKVCGIVMVYIVCILKKIWTDI